MAKTYSDLLKDPRWQKKRLEILQRDDFKCRSCDDNSTTLHVHHFYYDPDLLPWEYRDNDLITLCETCHNVITIINRILKYSNLGMESLIPVIRLIDKIESESIEKFIKSLEEKQNE